MAQPSDKGGHLLEEWKEARHSIGRFDEYLLNLRRYGFTLATIMIGADAYLSTSTSMSMMPWAKAGATVVVMMLIFTLFLLDEQVKSLRTAAVERAVKLEGELGLNLSVLLRDAGEARSVRHSGTLAYIFFMAAACALGSVASYETPSDSASLALCSYIPLGFVIGVFLVLCVLTLVYDQRAQRAVLDRVRFKRAIRRKAIEQIEIQAGMIILVIGPDLGGFKIEVAKRVGEEGNVFAIDTQSVAISSLKSSLESYQLENAFDRVFVFEVLGKIPDRGQALLQIKCVLKNSGLLVISESFMNPNYYLPDPHYLRRQTVIRECKKADFELVDQWGDHQRYLLTFVKSTAGDQPR